MSLRILIGHSQPGQRGSASLLYIGSSGGDLETARANAPATVGSFSIINNPTAIRKGHHKYDPAAKAAPASSDAAAVKTEIPDALKGLKKDELLSVATSAISRVKELEAIIAETAISPQKTEQTQEQKTSADTQPGSDEGPSKDS